MDGAVKDPAQFLMLCNPQVEQLEWDSFTCSSRAAPLGCFFPALLFNPDSCLHQARGRESSKTDVFLCVVDPPTGYGC